MNLGWCEGVTEEGVQSLAHCCSNLEVLDLCGCVKAGLSEPLYAVLHFLKRAKTTLLSMQYVLALHLFVGVGSDT